MAGSMVSVGVRGAGSKSLFGVSRMVDAIGESNAFAGAGRALEGGVGWTFLCLA